jgi:uncharacterized protein YfcZ (UPF0381/DUF406 family)
MAGERDPPIIPRMANGDRETSETAYVCRLRNIGETAPAGRRQTKRKTMSNNRMTKEDFLANRKAAGRMIDVETCKIMKKYTDLSDPYRLNPPPLRFHNDMFWVASDESGEVYVDDLPEDKRRALFARIEREDLKFMDDWPF